MMMIMTMIMMMIMMIIQVTATASLVSATCTAVRVRSVTPGLGSVSARRSMSAERVANAKVYIKLYLLHGSSFHYRWIRSHQGWM